MKKLFTPLSIRNIEIKNRVVMSPMCMFIAGDAKVNDFHIMHYASRALAQVGLIVIEATSISPEGRISDNDLGIWDDSFIAGLKILNEKMHTYGAKTCIQLGHAGRKALNSMPSVAPSAIAFNETSKIPHELSIDEVKEIIKKFIASAKRAIDAGFDCLELHAAHGYLINQFLSPLTNKRTDEYGGSIENRVSFLKEIILGIREFYNGVLFVRISATDYDENGMHTSDYIKIFNDEEIKSNIDLIDVSTGGILEIKPPNIFEGYQVQFSEEIKNNTNIPTGAVGLLGDYNFASNVLEKNQADLIFLGRPLLTDPHWVMNAAKQMGEKIEMPKVYERGYL